MPKKSVYHTSSLSVVLQLTAATMGNNTLRSRTHVTLLGGIHDESWQREVGIHQECELKPQICRNSYIVVICNPESKHGFRRAKSKGMMLALRKVIAVVSKCISRSRECIQDQQRIWPERISPTVMRGFKEVVLCTDGKDDI